MTVFTELAVRMGQVSAHPREKEYLQSLSATQAAAFMQVIKQVIMVWTSAEGSPGRRQHPLDAERYYANFPRKENAKITFIIHP